MKINYMKLSNIGPYKGEHLFDLTTSEDKNIILIGGKNGAGKTTFLKSIKYGLFGCFSMGQKNESETYFQEVRALLNNRSDSLYYIEINFDYNENLEKVNYTLRREWMIEVNEQIQENVKAYKNNDLLSDTQTKELIDKIRAVTSPAVINSFIFDGETVSNFISNGNISEYLKSSFYSLFGIDLLEQTCKDLVNYIDKDNEKTKSEDKLKNPILLNDINSLKLSIDNQKSRIEVLENAYKNQKQIRKSLMNDFNKLGGLTKEQKSVLLNKIDSIKKERQYEHQIINEFNEDILPFYILLPYMNKSLRQLKTDEKFFLLKQLSRIERVTGLDLCYVEDALNSKINNKKNLHEFDENLKIQIENILDRIDSLVPTIKKILDENNQKKDDFKFLKNKIENNDEVESIKNIISEIRDNDLLIENYSQQIENEKNELNSLSVAYQIKAKKYQEFQDELRKNNIMSKSYILANKALNFYKDYKNRIITNKLEIVSKRTLEIFSNAIRKNNFITKISIDLDFSFHIYNDDIELSTKNLSAGENQLLISSIIWAMFKESRRSELFIFDTPLARLDVDHRENFIKYIVSTISKQVVILSTDSEFIGENYNYIDNKIMREYLLSYDEEKNATSVLSTYFEVK